MIINIIENLKALIMVCSFSNFYVSYFFKYKTIWNFLIFDEIWNNFEIGNFHFNLNYINLYKPIN